MRISLKQYDVADLKSGWFDGEVGAGSVPVAGSDLVGCGYR